MPRNGHIPAAVFLVACALLIAVSAGIAAQESEPSSEQVMLAYQDAFRAVARRVLPVVVKIDVVDVITVPRTQFRSPFDFFFENTPSGEDGETRELQQPGLGSGVIVRRLNDRIYVLTNDHVVGAADQIEVTLHDGRTFEAELVGTDGDRDLALVSFPTTDEVPVAVLGDSDSLEVGDWAFAVGNPLGFESTITAGIVSGVGRRPTPGSGIGALTDYIQTDAAINRGNSGGALVNLRGEVVGINTWIASQTGGSIGLGFAIPINNAKRAIDEFIAFGEIEHGWLGVRYGGPFTSASARSLSVRGGDGTIVGGVFADSPAAMAGIVPGDVIRSIDGEDVEDWDDLVRIIANLSPGQTVSFVVTHDRRDVTRRVQISRRDGEGAPSNLGEWPGFSVHPLPDETREGLGMDVAQGTLVIGDVFAGSPAARSGLRSGDLVVRINNAVITSMEQFYAVINDRSEDEFSFRVIRRGREFIIGLVR